MAPQRALYLTVFLPGGLQLCPTNACEDVLLCTKERGEGEKPRTIKIYFCFCKAKVKVALYPYPAVPCSGSFP